MRISLGGLTLLCLLSPSWSLRQLSLRGRPIHAMRPLQVSSASAGISEGQGRAGVSRKPIRWRKFLWNNSLLIGEFIVITIARLNPRLGMTGGPLRPEFTISKLGVLAIFFINGIQLSLGATEDMHDMLRLNAFIQTYNMLFLPILARLLAGHYPDISMREGLQVLACLPPTINMCISQTQASGGNMVTAIFNAVFGNFIGVFLTPVLVIALMGVGQGVSLVSTLRKLGTLVIVPMVLGQMCRKTFIADYFAGNWVKKASEVMLLSIVFNTFSDTFARGIGVQGSSLVKLLGTLPMVYLGLSLLFWQISQLLFPRIDAKTRAAALFCSSQKTLAFGIPFIRMAFASRPDVAVILAPLLVYAPVELLIGSSLFVPWMRRRIEREAPQLLEGEGI